MKFRILLAPLLFCLLWTSHTRAQVIADFEFEDNSNPPASLLKNSIEENADALSVHENAISTNGGLYIVQDENLDTEENMNLQIPLSLVSETTDFYLEWQVNWQDDDGWLLSIDGETRGNPYISGIYFDDERGFAIRYFRHTDAGDTLIDSNAFEETRWQVGGPLEQGQEATLGFFYSYTEGMAYFYVNGQEIWRTTDSKNRSGEFYTAIPETPFNWNTSEGYITIGSGIKNGKDTQIPFLYNFRISNEACYVPAPEFASDTTNICTGETATFTASGGEEGRYRWYTSDAPDASPITDADGNPVSTATYQTPPLQETTTYYAAVLGEECDSRKVPVTAKVNEKPALPPASELNFSRCGPGEITLSLPTANGVTYNWYSSKDRSSLLEESRDSYTITADSDTAIYVEAISGSCSSGDPERIPVIVNPLPSVEAGPDLTVLKGDRIQLSALYHQDSVSSVQWSPADGLDISNSSSPWASPAVTTRYTITCTTTTGCTVTDSLTVRVIEEFPVTNAFSPNQDGRNDTWKIHNLKENYPNCKVMVYNSWGNQLFYSEGYTEEWDGTFNGKELPAGTYYYTIILNGEQEPVRGSLLIVK